MGSHRGWVNIVGQTIVALHLTRDRPMGILAFIVMAKDEQMVAGHRHLQFIEYILLLGFMQI
jgi:hypothetical protein